MAQTLPLNQSLRKGLAVLRHIAAYNGRLTMTELAAALHMDKGTMRRFLGTLLELGYIRCAPDKTFSVSLAVLELGYAALRGMEWREIARTFLEKLFDELDQTLSLSVSLCVLDGSDVLYLVRMEKPGFLPLDLRIGSRRPAYASSMGKMILAMQPEALLPGILDRLQIVNLTPHTVRNRQELLRQLAEIRNKGYAISDREVSLLTRSLAVPIVCRGQTIAAAAIAVQAERLSAAELERTLLPRLRACADAIAQALEYVEYKPA